MWRQPDDLRRVLGRSRPRRARPAERIAGRRVLLFRARARAGTRANPRGGAAAGWRASRPGAVAAGTSRCCTAPAAGADDALRAAQPPRHESTTRVRRFATCPRAAGAADGADLGHRRSPGAEDRDLPARGEPRVSTSRTTCCAIAPRGADRPRALGADSGSARGRARRRRRRGSPDEATNVPPAGFSLLQFHRQRPSAALVGRRGAR